MSISMNINKRQFKPLNPTSSSTAGHAVPSSGIGISSIGIGGLGGSVGLIGSATSPFLSSSSSDLQLNRLGSVGTGHDVVSSQFNQSLAHRIAFNRDAGVDSTLESSAAGHGKNLKSISDNLNKPRLNQLKPISSSAITSDIHSNNNIGINHHHQQQHHLASGEDKLGQVQGHGAVHPQHPQHHQHQPLAPPPIVVGGSHLSISGLSGTGGVTHNHVVNSHSRGATHSQLNSVKLASISSSSSASAASSSSAGKNKEKEKEPTNKGSSTDPFSTPARRRRIVAEMTRAFLKHACITACDNVHLFRIRTKAAIKIQSIVRMFLSIQEMLRLRFVRQTKASIRIQSLWRMKRARILRKKLFKIWYLKVTTHLAKLLQARRKVSIRRKYRRQYVKKKRWEVKLLKDRSALMIQSTFRMHKKRKYYIRKILRPYRAALKITSAVRIIIAKKKVRRLRSIYILMNHRIRIWWWRFKRQKLVKKWMTITKAFHYVPLLHAKFQDAKTKLEMKREAARKQKLLEQEKANALKTLPPKVIIEKINTSTKSFATVACPNEVKVRHFIDLSVLRRLITLGTFDTVHYLLDLGLIYFHNSSNKSNLDARRSKNSDENDYFCGFSLGAVFHRVIYTVNNLLLGEKLSASNSPAENVDATSVSANVGFGLDARHFETLFPYFPKELLRFTADQRKNSENQQSQSQIVRDSIDNQGHRSVIMTDNVPFWNSSNSNSNSSTNNNSYFNTNSVGKSYESETHPTDNKLAGHNGKYNNIPSVNSDEMISHHLHLDDPAKEFARPSSATISRPFSSRRSFKRPVSGITASGARFSNSSIEHYNSIFRREEYDQFRFPDKAIFMSNDNYDKFNEFFDANDDNYDNDDNDNDNDNHRDKKKVVQNKERSDSMSEEEIRIKKQQYEDTLESIIPMRWSQIVSRKTSHSSECEVETSDESPLKSSLSKPLSAHWDFSLERNDNSIEISIQFYEFSDSSSTTVEESSIALTLSDIVHGYDGEDSFMKRSSRNRGDRSSDNNSQSGDYESVNFTSEFPPGKSNVLPGDVVKRIHSNVDHKTTKRVLSSFKLFLEPDKSDVELFDDLADKGHLQPAQGMIKPWPKFDKDTSVLKFMFRDILVIVGGHLGDQKEKEIVSNKLPIDHDYVEDIDVGEGPSDFDKDFTKEFDRDSAEEYKRNSAKSRASSGKTRPITATVRIVSDEEIYKKMESDDITIIQSLIRMKLAKKRVFCIKIQRCYRRLQSFGRFKMVVINVLLLAHHAAKVIQRFIRSFLSVCKVDRLRKISNLELKKRIEVTCDGLMYDNFETSLLENISNIAKYNSSLEKKRGKLKPAGGIGGNGLANDSFGISMNSFIAVQTLTYSDTIKISPSNLLPKSNAEKSGVDEMINFYSENKAIVSSINKNVDRVVYALLDGDNSENGLVASPKLEDSPPIPPPAAFSAASKNTLSLNNNINSDSNNNNNNNNSLLKSPEKFEKLHLSQSFESKVEFNPYSNVTLDRLQSLNSRKLLNNLDPENNLFTSSKNNSGGNSKSNIYFSDVATFDLKMLEVLKLDSFGGSHIPSSQSNAIDKNFFSAIVTPKYQLSATIPSCLNRKSKKKKSKGSDFTSKENSVSNTDASSIIHDEKGKSEGKVHNDDGKGGQRSLGIGNGLDDRDREEDNDDDVYADSDNNDDDDDDDDVQNIFIQQALEKYANEEREKGLLTSPSPELESDAVKALGILSPQEKAKEYIQLYSIIKSEINYNRLLEKIEREKASKAKQLQESIAKQSTKNLNKRFHSGNKSFDIILPAGFDENGVYYDPIGLIKVQKELSGYFIQSPNKPKSLSSEDDDFNDDFSSSNLKNKQRFKGSDSAEKLEFSEVDAEGNKVGSGASAGLAASLSNSNQEEEGYRLNDSDMKMVFSNKVVDLLLFPEFFNKSEFNHS